MLRRRSVPRWSMRMIAGSIPVTPMPAIASGARPQVAISDRAMAPTLAHHSSGSSSAQFSSGVCRVTGRLSIASVRPAVSITIPIVEVVPMSRPSRSAMSAQGSNLVHEAGDAFHIDPVERLAVDLEMSADNGAVADAEDRLDTVARHARIGEDRRFRHRFLGLLEARGVDRLAGHRTGNQDDIGQ